MSNNELPKTERTIPEQRKWLGFTLAILLAGGAFFSGLYLGDSGLLATQQAKILAFFGNKDAIVTGDEPVDLKEFWKVWDLLEKKFITASTTKVMTNDERIQGAIEGLVDSYGDPYTVYLPPSEAAFFEDDISGNFSGVGMEVGLQDSVITIISPLPGTPAQRAGLLPGDVIVKINDTSTEDMRIDEAVRLIRGEKDTVVTFTIYREGQTEFLVIPVTRDNIDIPTVKTEQVGDTYIIALYSFNAISETKMQEAMNQFVSSGASNLVIDVRGNPGGFMQSAVDIASLFLPAGEVVVREQIGPEGEDKIFRSRNRQVREFTPQNLVVLVDNGSASASEILAGALHDHGVATIIGTATFGKGSVQELVPLSDGSSLKVTVARWFTPDGISISDGGLKPNIVIKRTPEDRESGKDPQKEAALKFLSGENVVSEEVISNLINQSVGS